MKNDFHVELTVTDMSTTILLKTTWKALAQALSNAI